MDVLQFGLELPADLEVERGQGLVKQEDLGIIRDRPRECHPLRLTAREFCHPAVAELGQPD